jgi:hypothetical protein
MASEMLQCDSMAPCDYHTNQNTTEMEINLTGFYGLLETTTVEANGNGKGEGECGELPRCDR